MTAKAFLGHRKARPFFGRHPWVFESAIDRIDGDPAPGDPVEVYSHEREFIAHGLYNPHSLIRIRLYSWDKDVPVSEELVRERIVRAIAMRREIGLDVPGGGVRLVYSESDALSGLVVDRYADFCAVQFTSLALARFESTVIEAIREAVRPRGIYRRTERGIGELEGLRAEDGPMWGEVPEEPIAIVENGLSFLVDVRTGQKTGYFLDQRENRLAASRYARGRDVLDLYCHSGGFAISLLKLGNARSAIAADISGPALALAQRNADVNGVTLELRQENAPQLLEAFRSEGRRFGMICADPPKFARASGAKVGAIRGYEALNRMALELLDPGGILVTSSCSGHLSADEFVEIIVTAAQKLGRDIQILEQRGQAPDHPVSGFCLETGYLKCVIARAV